MKKGFTLIELLAVIVILAIIALIVTPVISNIINNSKKAAAVQSAREYISGVEKYMVLQRLDTNMPQLEGNNTYRVSNDGAKAVGLNDIIDVSGTRPTGGYVQMENNKISKIKLKINGFTIRCGETVDTCRVDEGMKFVDISAGGDRMIALDEDGNIWAWGDNDRNLSNLGDVDKSVIPVMFENNLKFKKIATGNCVAFAIDENDNLYTWGINNFGQFGEGGRPANEGVTIHQVKDDTKFKDIAVDDHTLALDINGGLWVSGNNSWGGLGIGTSGSRTSITSFIRIKEDTTFASVKSGSFQSLAIDSDGNLWAWGAARSGCSADLYSPYQVSAGTKFVFTSGLNGIAYAIDVYGNLYEFQSSCDGPAKSSLTKIVDGTKFVDVAYGESSYTSDNFTLALDVDGNLWTWGRNSYGQLGNGTTRTVSNPTMLQLDAKFVKVEVGKDISAAIDTKGNLWTWGRNNYGQLGNGTTENNTVPTKIEIDD